MEDRPKGTLFLVGTPIGNLQDITLRALETLKNVDLIAAEDTRHTQKLLNHFGIKKPVTSYFEHNRLQKGPLIIRALQEGKNVALVSDAGMPGISDPGSDLIRECVAGDVPVTVIPGPSAVLTGLVASGLETKEFVYAGFLPRAKKEKQQILVELADEPRTVIFFESPRRIARTLADILAVWGERRCCVARELTKIHEEYLRGALSEVLSLLKDKAPLKGEITLIVAGNDSGSRARLGAGREAGGEALVEAVCEAENEIERLIAAGLSKKEAVREASRLLGLPKRELYNRFMKQK